MSTGRRRAGDDQRTNENLAELAKLKPPEELQGQESPTGPLEGSIRVDETHLPVPDGIIESDSKSWLRIESVVLVIAALMLVFIAFIAWQVSLMSGPAKP